MHNIYATWANILLQHQKKSVALLAFISILLAILCGKNIEKNGIPLDFTPQSIFIDQGEMVQTLNAIESIYGREDNDFIILLEESNTPYLHSATGKAELEKLHNSLVSIEGIEQVRSVVNAVSLAPDLQQQELWQRENPWQASVQDPLLHGLFSSDDEKYTVLYLQVHPDTEKISDLEPVLANITQTIEQSPLAPKVDIRITGVPYIRTEVVEMMWKDELFYIPITALMFLCTLSWLFGGLRMSIAPIVAVLLSIHWAVSILILQGVTFNILSMLIPAITLIIGIADGIHIIARYREELSLDKSKLEALTTTLSDMTWACFLTSFTTAAGFVSLLVADTKVITDFGLHSAIAVGISYLGVILVIPLWLTFVPDHVAKLPEKDSASWQQFFTKIHQFTKNYPKQIIAVGLLCCAASVYMAKDVTANSFILEMYPPDHPTTENLHILENELSGIVPFFVHISLDTPQTQLYSLDMLEKIDKLEQYMREFSAVGWTYSLASHQKRLHWSLSGENTLPNTQDMLAQEMFLAELSEESNMFLDKIVTPNKQSTRILALSRDVGGIEFLDIQSKIEQRAQALFQDTPVQITITGDGMLASVGIDKLIRDLLSSVVTVFSIIGILFLLMLRRVGFTIIACIPNVIPLLIALAFLHFMGSNLQVSNIVSFTVAIGLAVDDTIHFVIRYQTERRRGHDHDTAMYRCFQGAGQAILLTSILLVSGFGVLATSQLTSTFFFGTLTAITLITAFVADIFLLPAMMNLWKKYL